MDLDFVSVHKNAKKELGQYPAILTSRLVNNAYISKLGFKPSNFHMAVVVAGAGTFVWDDFQDVFLSWTACYLVIGFLNR